MEEKSIIELYRKEIYRIGWRIQYKAKKTYRREVPIISESFSAYDITSQSENSLHLKELINSLPSRIEQTILHELFLNDKTEAQLARQLNMTQQAVNKRKKIALKYLSQMVSF